MNFLHFHHVIISQIIKWKEIRGVTSKTLIRLIMEKKMIMDLIYIIKTIIICKIHKIS